MFSRHRADAWSRATEELTHIDTPNIPNRFVYVKMFLFVYFNLKFKHRSGDNPRKVGRMCTGHASCEAQLTIMKADLADVHEVFFYSRDD